MELPNISVHFLVQELRPSIENSRISKIQSIGKNAFRFKLSTSEGTRELILLPHAFFLTNYRIPSAAEQPNLVLLLRKHLEGKRIQSFSQKNWDRLVEFGFEEARLVLELFADGNLVLVGEDGKTLGCLHREEWKDRKIQRGFPYQYPFAKPIPSNVSFKDFSARLSASPKKTVSALVENYNLFPPLAEESVLESGIPKEKNANALTQSELQKLHRQLESFFSETKPKPLVAQTQKEKILLPFCLSRWITEHGFKAEEADSLNSALDSFFAPLLSSGLEPEEKKGANQKLQKLLFSLEQQKKAVEKFEGQEKEAKAQAEWIFSHYAELVEIKKALEAAEQKGIPEKKALQTLQASDVSGFEIAAKIVELNLKKKRVVLEA